MLESPACRVLGLEHGEIEGTGCQGGGQGQRRGSQSGKRTNGGDKPIRNLYLVDGSGYLFRAYHALPPMTRPDGVPINAVYGFCRMLVADLLDKPEVDHIAMILDAGEVTFRNEIYDKYKANRPPPPEDLIPQFPLIREAARAFNVTVCELKGYEADDLIATYARLAVEAGATCTIVSSDKDLMQLIRPGVELMDPIKKTKLGPEAVMEKFGVTPDKVIDVQALAGDSTDNVPGVPGIGVKTAAQLINEYGDLETLLKRAGEIKQPKRREALQQNAELARISRKLVTLRDDVPTPAEPEAFDKKKPDPNVLLPWLEQQGFKSLLARFTGELGEATAPVAPAAPAARPALPAPETKPAPAARAKSNQPFTAADYELITDEAALDEWIAEATRAGTVAFDCETDALDAQQRRSGRRVARPARRPVGQRQLDQAARGLPAAQPSQARRRGAGRARPFRRRRGQGCRRPAARPDPAQEGDRQAEAAARGPVGPQGRPEHQVRHVRVPPARRRGRRRSTTPCCCPSCSMPASTITAWTSSPSSISARTPSSSPTWPAAAPSRWASTRCRSTRRATTPPRTPTSPCSCGRSSSPGSPASTWSASTRPSSGR